MHFININTVILTRDLYPSISQHKLLLSFIPTHSHTNTHTPTLTDLKNENAELVEENKSLKAYIEQLLLNIMDSRPDILEFGKLHPPPHSSNGIMQ